MDKFQAARALGLAEADVLTVEETEDGTKVTVRDGGDRLIRDDGVWALTDHPATAQLRRIVPGYGRWAEVEADDKPVESDEDVDGVPDGTAAELLTWVGEDRERAAQALAVEESREHPRSTLVDKLRKLA